MIEHTYMPYDKNSTFIVDVIYQCGSEMRASGNKLKDVVAKAECMVVFGLQVVGRKVYQNTFRTVKENGRFLSIYEVIV